MRPQFRWQLRNRVLELGTRTLIMGVLNVTPDSFSDGGEFFEPERAIEHGLRLLEEGADILDIGGESTRPGTNVGTDETATSPSVSEEEELRRVLPVLEGIRKLRPESILSIDTYKSGVAQKAVDAGAEIVNDVSALHWDQHMAKACADLRCGVVLMHTRGKPTEWKNLSVETDMSAVVMDDLAARVQVALGSSIKRQSIVLDPGFGFGKRYEENFPLLANLQKLQELGFPLLAGTSRKSFVGRSIGKRRGGDEAQSYDRLYGSLAALTASILHGAHIVRVHEVAPAVDAAAIADEVLAASQTN
jgi:dihydropteroate synthase